MEQGYEEDGVMNGTTVVDLVAAPTAGIDKELKLLSVSNKDTGDIELTINLDNEGDERRLWKGTLEPGDTFFLCGHILDDEEKKITGVLTAEPAVTQPDFVASSKLQVELEGIEA